MSTTGEGREFWAELQAAGKAPKHPRCQLCHVQLRDDTSAPHYAILSFEDDAAVFLAICRGCGESLEASLREKE